MAFGLTQGTAFAAPRIPPGEPTMARQPIQPEGIPKTIIPPAGPATNPADLGDLPRAAEPRPAAAGSAPADAPRGAPPARSGDSPSMRDLPGRQPSDAAPPPDDEGPLESLGKAISAPVREAGGAEFPAGERGGSARSGDARERTSGGRGDAPQ